MINSKRLPMAKGTAEYITRPKLFVDSSTTKRRLGNITSKVYDLKRSQLAGKITGQQFRQQRSEVQQKANPAAYAEKMARFKRNLAAAKANPAAYAAEQKRNRRRLGLDLKKEML